MVDYSKELVSALNKVLRTYHELALTSQTKTPCISYQERNNYTSISGDTQEYSVVSYTIKVWDNDIEQIQKYALQIDKKLKPLGFKRVSAGELADPQSAMIQKIMVYECKAHEKN